MKHIAIAGVLAAAACQVGCATIFTGTSDKVVIDVDPPGSTCAVIGGGGVGGLLVTAAQANVAMRRIIEIIAPSVSPEHREKLARLDFNELVAALVMKSRIDSIPPEVAEGAGAIINALPKSVIDKVIDVLGIEEVGASPMSVELHKGRSWAVLCFKPGYKARIELVGLRFNVVTILNFLNFFIGCGVDLLTGAMFNLEDRVRVHLKPRG